MPKRAGTGTQKKEQKKQVKLETKILEQGYKNLRSQGAYGRSARHALKDIQRGRGEPMYDSSATYEPDKFKQQTKYNTSTLKNLTRDFERAGKGAEKIYEPIKQQALAEFQQNTVPGIQNALGSEVKGSSALNQAMAAAGGNLQRGLASDFAGLQANLANSLLGQRESSRQFGAQFGAQGEQFGAQLRNQQQQFGSQFLENQAQFQNQSALQALDARLRASGTNIGQSVFPGNTATVTSHYAPQRQGDNTLGQGLGGLGQGLGAAGTAWALSSLSGSSKEVKENIEDYEKGLEEVLKMDVKKYDYTIDVPGHKKGRIGLIAEDLPKDVQVQIEGINHVDVYGLVAILVNAVKDLNEKMIVLEAKNA